MVTEWLDWEERAAPKAMSMVSWKCHTLFASLFSDFSRAHRVRDVSSLLRSTFDVALLSETHGDRHDFFSARPLLP